MNYFLKKVLPLVLISLFFISCTTQIKSTDVTKVKVNNLQKYPYKVALLLPDKLKDYVYVQQTSPFDKVSYPLGKITCENFIKNAPVLFENQVVINSLDKAENVDLIIEPQILDFKLFIPVPAYNPHKAEIKYNVVVYNKNKEEIFQYDVIGKAQHSKGLMSGFHTKKICAEVTQMSIENGIKLIIEELSETEELEDLK